MLARAGVVAVDTGPEQLRVSAQVERLPAVAVHRVEVPPHRLELRILAASHQVVVWSAGGGRGGRERVRHVETVACRLMPSAEPLVHGGVYDLGSWCVAASVVHLDAESFAEQAEAWTARGRHDGRCVAVRFPNHPHALTALAVGDSTADHQGSGGGVAWTGIHLYPSAGGGGAVVRTTTSRTPPARSSARGTPGSSTATREAQG